MAEEGAKKTIKIYLKYAAGNIAGDFRASSACRGRAAGYTSGAEEIPRVLGGLGINILTTPRGVMTGRDARKEGVGGEVLCQVWYEEYSDHVENWERSRSRCPKGVKVADRRTNWKWKGRRAS